MTHKQWLLGATSVLTLSLAQAVSAQTADTADSNAMVETVVVTGTQIQHENGYTSSTPITAISAETLENMNPGTLSDALNTMPQFRGSSMPQAGGVSANGATGSNLLNLRNLGVQRNLVMLDGHRFVGGADSGGVDINELPQGLVDRVDVVTGGASAAYGSDAVAGVVNFVLQKHFEGIKGTIQGGVSTYGDAKSAKASVALGQSFANGKGHFEGDVEYYDSGGLGPDESKRRWNQTTFGLIPNTTGNGPAQLIVPDNVYVSAATFGGLITSGPLKGIQFGPGGQPVPFAYGSNVSSSFMEGGDGIRNNANLSAGLRRYNIFARADYDITNDFNVYAEFSFAKATTRWDQYNNYSYSTYAATIFSDNAYLPQEIKDQMADAGITSFKLGRIHSENYIKADNEKQLLRGVVGFNGQFNDDWSYRGYYTHGENKIEIGNLNTLIYRNYYAAIDAVRDPVTNQIVCHSNLTGGDPGCVPFNPFGAGSPSDAALNYVEGNEFRYLTLKQNVVSATIQGDNLFSLWSDPASTAFGVEYRQESSDQRTDPFTQTTIDFAGVRGGPPGLQGQLGPFQVGNPQPLAGSFDVKEAFAEFSVPIVKDIDFVRKLDFDGALRVTDYSTSGVVVTWKASLSYSPTDDFRLRGTRSRDIRGPNTAELFTGAAQGIGTAIDPATGDTVDVTTKTGGNPNLAPEKADTWTGGIVLTPTWFDGFSASIDYYHINIGGAIATLGRQQTFDQCFQGNQTACSNITETAPGAYLVELPYLNLNSLKVAGFDIEASYATDLLGGKLNLHAYANHQGRYQEQTPGSDPIDYADEVGRSDNPEWEGQFQADFRYGAFATTLTERFIGSGIFDVTYVEGVDINDNTVPSTWYTDASFRYDMGENANYEFYLTVNNLFNQPPPLAPQVSGTHLRYSNFELYSPIGRYYTLGLRFTF